MPNSFSPPACILALADCFHVCGDSLWAAALYSPHLPNLNVSVPLFFFFLSGPFNLIALCSEMQKRWNKQGYCRYCFIANGDTNMVSKASFR